MESSPSDPQAAPARQGPGLAVWLARVAGVLWLLSLGLPAFRLAEGARHPLLGVVAGFLSLALLPLSLRLGLTSASQAGGAAGETVLRLGLGLYFWVLLLAQVSVLRGFLRAWGLPFREPGRVERAAGLAAAVMALGALWLPFARALSALGWEEFPLHPRVGYFAWVGSLALAAIALEVGRRRPSGEG